MIVTDKNKINTPCEVVSIKEGEEIGVKLLHELRNSKNGIGLAANQIGINKRVCVVNVKEPLVLINPKIVEHSEEHFIFPEGCLSFPNKHIRKKRYSSIVVETDNHKDKLSFSADSKEINDAFECACVQHEIDHLDGITMFDRKYVTEPYRAPKSYGRNEKVTITDGDETKVMKYKKAQSLIESGVWKISDIQINV